MAITHRSRLVRVADLTVRDAGDLYLSQIHERATAGQVTWGHYQTTHHRLGRVVEIMGADLALSAVTKGTLQSAVLAFASRPLVKEQAYHIPVPGQRVSVVTAKGCISMIKALFVWLADHDQLTWQLPRGFERIFRLKESRLKTPEEVATEAASLVSHDVSTFTHDELARLFRAGRSLDRLYMLLGLNCGFTSGEISSLRTFEVFPDAAEPYIHRRRPKTGVEAKWLLWPETAGLLRRHRAPANQGLRWLGTREGNQLVEVTEDWRRDSVVKAWRFLHARVNGVRQLGFRFLRKTGANHIKRLGGLEESEMYLAHQEGGLNKHYANRNWPRLWACLSRLRAELPFLGPAWDMDPGECLFTQNGNPDWAEVNPSWVQRVNKRNKTGFLNVSYHPEKKRYFARVYQKGTTYFSPYVRTPEEASEAAKGIRLALERGLRPAARPWAERADRRGP